MTNRTASSQEQNLASEWFLTLRDQICTAFEDLEYEFDPYKPGKFDFHPWKHRHEGGGVSGVMKGKVFEKVGVNISTVHGHFSENFAKKIPGTEKSSRYWASGISVVAHMQNPHVPAIHMNTRFIITGQSWFGGGVDLTPVFPIPQDTEDFHSALKKACHRYDTQCYEKFKKWCDDYFYLPHRKEPRGVGGIFYDHLHSSNWKADFSFTQDVGKTFLKIFPDIVRRRMLTPWTLDEREAQLKKRGRYVEFNLLYDRGTLFGLETGGNTEAILMSLPPLAKW